MLKINLALLTPQNIEILRRIDDLGHPIETLDGFARDIGDMDPSNFRKVLKRLEDGSLIHRNGQDNDVGHPCGLFISLEGKRALQAADVSEGRSGPNAGTMKARAGTIRANPLNPRTTFDEAEIEQIADSIAEKGLLTPLLVSAPDAEGIRTLFAGEKRWRAINMLIDQDRASSEFEWKIVEHDGDPTDVGEVKQIALIENGQRGDLNKVEQATAYRDLCEANHWSAREAAIKTGKDPRVVQEDLKVLKEASEDDIAAYLAGTRTWKELRQEVKAPSGEMTAKLRMLFAEVVHAVSLRPMADKGRLSRSTRIVEMPTGGGGRDVERLGYIHLERTAMGPLVELTDEGAAFAARSWRTDDPAGFLWQTRVEVLGSVGASNLTREGRYATDWLNVPGAGQAIKAIVDPPKPQAPSRTQSGSEVERRHDDAFSDLGPLRLLALVELADKVERAPSEEHPGCTPIIDNLPDPSGLRARLPYMGGGFLSATSRDGTRFYGAMAGSTVEKRLRDLDSYPSPENRDDLLLRLRTDVVGRQEAERFAREDLYVTPWLNAPAEPALDLAPAGEHVTREDESLPDLDARQRLAMIELAHLAQLWAVGQDPAVPPAPPIGAHWTSRVPNDLVEARLIFILNKGAGSGPHAQFTERGMAWLESQHLVVGGRIYVTDADLNHARVACGQALWPASQGFVTDWLNPIKATLPADPAPEPEQGDLEQEAADKAAAELLSHVEMLQAQVSMTADMARVPAPGATLATRFETICAAAGMPLPWSTGDGDLIGSVIAANGEEVVVADHNGQLADDLARAKAALVALCGNVMGGMKVGLATEIVTTRPHAEDCPAVAGPEPDASACSCGAASQVAA